MIQRFAIAALVAAMTAFTAAGCAVTRHQETVGAYVDDAAITTKVKAKFADDPTVSAMSIKVDTLRGVVQLSGFVDNSEAKATAEELARSVDNVKSVDNELSVKK